jgi:uncharacterized protein YecE (DUF72 family)
MQPKQVGEGERRNDTVRRAKARMHIGTSGWSYAHWRGPFYPSALRDEEMLGFYCRRFRSVEINNSFYHLPTKAALEHWRDTAPAGFVFSVKASRYITHMKKLKDPQQGLETLLDRISCLGDKLGPLLFQLPPNWRYNHERLSAFLDSLGRDFSCAFEFRDRSWLNPQCYELLSRHGAALCLYELDGFLSPRELTADFVYVRLHGPAGPYQGNYDTPTLAGWADAFSTWAAQGRSIYCYFDNDEAGYAVQNAEALQAMLNK